jgi:hypothetical protein
MSLPPAGTRIRPPSDQTPPPAWPTQWPATATSRPIRPNPITPRVFPVISVPTNFARSHFPAVGGGVRLGRVPRQREQERQGLFGGGNGVPPRHIGHHDPLRDAAPKSILSTPVPARPMKRSFLAAAITSAVTFVSDRTKRASHSATSFKQIGALQACLHLHIKARRLTKTEPAPLRKWDPKQTRWSS